MTQTLEEQAHICRSNTNTIDIIHGTTSDDSLQGRPRSGEATEWHPREPQAPEGKGTATLKFRTTVRLKC